MATKKKVVVDTEALVILLESAIRLNSGTEHQRRRSVPGEIVYGRIQAFDAVLDYLRGSDHRMKIYAGSD